MKLKIVAVLMAVAMAWVGLAAVVVCAMPPECPMQQSSSAQHDCCAQPEQTLSSCHLEQIAAIVVRAALIVPSLNIFTLQLSDALPPPAVTFLSSATTAQLSPPDVPLYLLTQSLRL